MDEDKRPEWDYPITIAQARKLEYGVDKITRHMHMTSPDTSKNWIEFHTDKGKFVPPHKWDMLFEFNPDHRSLIVANYRGEDMLRTLRQIEAWERKHVKELKEFKRLKEKFGDVHG